MGLGQFEVRFPVWARHFFYSIPMQTNPRVPSSLLYNWYWDVVLTTHPQLMLRLRMRAAIPLPPLCLLQHVIGWPLPLHFTFKFYFKIKATLCVHKYLPLDPNLAWINLVQALTLYFSKIHLCVGHHICTSNNTSCSAISFFNSNGLGVMKLPDGCGPYLPKSTSITKLHLGDVQNSWV